VAALRAVEEVLGLAGGGLVGGGVGVGVGHRGGAAVLPDAQAEVRVYERGGEGGEEDVAVCAAKERSGSARGSGEGRREGEDIVAYPYSLGTWRVRSDIVLLWSGLFEGMG
jgi:hypothetical protein